MQTLNKIKAIRTKSERLNNYQFYLANTSELQLYINIGAFEKGILLIDKIKNRVLENKARNIYLFCKIMIVYFGAQEFHQANEYLNKLLNSKLDFRDDVQCFARIMNLIIHYEMGNTELLPYITKSSMYFLTKKKGMNVFEELFIKFFRTKLLKIDTKPSGVRQNAKLT